MNEEYINIPRRVEEHKGKGEYWCPKHGFYWQRIYDHNRGHGCRHCAIIKRNKGYNYSNVNKKRRKYRPDIPKWVLDMMPIDEEREKVKNKDFGSNEKFHFRCDKGHITERSISNVFSVRTGAPREGCLLCSSRFTYRSKGERQVEFWCKKQGFRLGPRRGILTKNRELDIFLQDLGVAIEYDGEAWHQEGDYTREEYLELKRNSKNSLTRDELMKIPKWKGYHREKDEECLSLGIILVHITDYEWNTNREECKKRIFRAIEEAKTLDRKYPDFGDYEFNDIITDKENSVKMEPKSRSISKNIRYDDGKRYYRNIPAWFREEYNYYEDEVERNQNFIYHCDIHGDRLKAYKLIVGRNGEDISECRFCKCTRTRNSKRIVPEQLKDYVTKEVYDGLLNGTISSKDYIDVICPECGEIHNNEVGNMLVLGSGKIKSLKCRHCARVEMLNNR